MQYLKGILVGLRRLVQSFIKCLKLLEQGASCVQLRCFLQLHVARTWLHQDCFALYQGFNRRTWRGKGTLYSCERQRRGLKKREREREREGDREREGERERGREREREGEGGRERQKIDLG